VSDVYERVKASGIELPSCLGPAGSHVPGKVFGSFVFASGQTLRANGYVASSEGYEEQPAVINGATCCARSSATPASTPEPRSRSTLDRR
jgi:hypothetical protein